MPAITKNQCNSQVMWTKNKTHKFMKENFNEDTHAFVCQEACALNQSKHEKRTHMKQVKAWKQWGQENKEH